MKILFVINPLAGGTSHEKTILSLKELVKAKGFESKFFFTSGDSDVKNIRRFIEKFQPDRVVSGEGDGAILLVAKMLIPYGLTLGILPLGSANWRQCLKGKKV